MLSGQATRTATEAFAAAHGSTDKPGFYRPAGGLTVSSLGIGTYLGSKDPETDAAYVEAIETALQSGINVIDTSLNYRHQRSERNIGHALLKLVTGGEILREEAVICTKAGFLVPGAVPDGIDPEDIVDGSHCMAPRFLLDQMERSRANLGLDTIDVFYLHNPESQLGPVEPDRFYARIRRAFETLEQAVASRRIAAYGAATWNGFRQPQESRKALSLARMAAIAEEIAGRNHHFRFIQLPINLAMPEAWLLRVTDLARDLGITVVSSASILQSKLASDLPEGLREHLGPNATDAQRAIQFTRSTPGVTVALVGMSKRAHVEENFGVASMAPLTPAQFEAVFERLKQ